MDFAVIMAGGTGKRLWPLSRESHPKQILKLLGGQTLLRKCYDRLRPIFDNRNIIVQCNAGYADLVRENLPELPRDNVIAEPTVRDTAGAIGLASAVLSKFDPDATMAVVTADQLIRPDEIFAQAIKDGLAFVNNNPKSFITFGIEPKFPSTQYGYLELGQSDNPQFCSSEVFKVDSFKEKPDSLTARQYIQMHKYCWNSGMFVWKASAILNKIFENVPDAKKPLIEIQSSWATPKQEEVLEDWFVEVPKISIDYAVMEKADNVYSIKMNCDWLDMGSFISLADIVEPDENDNVVIADNSELLGCKDCIVVTEDDGHMIAAIGMQNFVIAHSPDATLVCPVEQADKLKELLERIKKKGKETYL